jgi:shikimate kinase
MRIYLVGYMASGKSNLGRELAEALGYQFTDTDQVFEERYRISILDFFAKYDEDAFRSIESQLLRETGALENTVISTGGGTPCFHGNMDFILGSGLSIYLHWEIPDLVERLKIIRKKRPLLKDVPTSGLEDLVRNHMKIRGPFYEQAGIMIGGMGIDIPALAVRLRQLGA